MVYVKTKRAMGALSIMVLSLLLTIPACDRAENKSDEIYDTVELEGTGSNGGNPALVVLGFDTYLTPSEEFLWTAGALTIGSLSFEFVFEPPNPLSKSTNAATQPRALEEPCTGIVRRVKLPRPRQFPFLANHRYRLAFQVPEGVRFCSIRLHPAVDEESDRSAPMYRAAGRRTDGLPVLFTLGLGGAIAFKPVRGSVAFRSGEHQSWVMVLDPSAVLNEVDVRGLTAGVDGISRVGWGGDPELLGRLDRRVLDSLGVFGDRDDDGRLSGAESTDRVGAVEAERIDAL